MKQKPNVIALPFRSTCDHARLLVVVLVVRSLVNYVVYWCLCFGLFIFCHSVASLFSNQYMSLNIHEVLICRLSFVLLLLLDIITLNLCTKIVNHKTYLQYKYFYVYLKYVNTLVFFAYLRIISSLSPRCIKLTLTWFALDELCLKSI